MQVPEDIGQSEEKRQDVKEVGLMFALPMKEDAVTACPDPHAGLFAFLPVAEYGRLQVGKGQCQMVDKPFESLRAP